MLRACGCLLIAAYALYGADNSNGDSTTPVGLHYGADTSGSDTAAPVGGNRPDDRDSAVSAATIVETPPLPAAILPDSSDTSRLFVSDSAAAPPVADTVHPATVYHPKKKTGPHFAPRESLYIGISPEQDYYARRYVKLVFAFQWSEADKTIKKLQKIERKDRLAPLSALLGVSCRVFRLLNGEYESEAEQKTLLHEAQEMSTKALHQNAEKACPDSLLPVMLFIEGGIRGLNAALQIEINPVAAAVDGFAALNRLERLFELSTSIEDAWLGYGLFYCSLARAPAIVRAALNIGGKPVSFDEGLDYLRRSAYRGRYTSELSKLYLIQFLSPYWGHLAEEKNRIFADLRKRYSANPLYVFLNTDEDICFHPERLGKKYAAHLKQATKSFRSNTYSLHRYDTLVRCQLRFITDDSTIAPHCADSSAVLREFEFYPQFLNVLAKKRYHGTGDEAPRLKKTELNGDFAAVVRSLGLSKMGGIRKNFYEWHIRDALKLR